MTRFIVFVALGVITVSVVFLTHNVAFVRVKPWSENAFYVALVGVAFGAFLLAIAAEKADSGQLSPKPADRAGTD